MIINRPTISKETILEAAKEIAIDVQGDAEDIAKCYYEHIDGYELAKRLENDCSWDIQVDMIDSLDCMHCVVEGKHNEVLKKWVVDSDIKPPFEDETEIKQGIIKGICEHRSAYFKVKETGCTNESRYLLIKFENAVAA